MVTILTTEMAACVVSGKADMKVCVALVFLSTLLSERQKDRESLQIYSCRDVMACEHVDFRGKTMRDAHILWFLGHQLL